MKVKQLIEELIKMPQDHEIRVATPDDFDYAGANIWTIAMSNKATFPEGYVASGDATLFSNCPNEFVLMRLSSTRS